MIASYKWSPRRPRQSTASQGALYYTETFLLPPQAGLWLLVYPSGQSPSSAHLCDLHTPVEQVLGADVVLVLSDIVQEAAIGHQLCDELDGGGQADAQEAADMGVVHTGHHIGFLQGKDNRCITIAPWQWPHGSLSR